MLFFLTISILLLVVSVFILLKDCILLYYGYNELTLKIVIKNNSLSLLVTKIPESKDRHKCEGNLSVRLWSYITNHHFVKFAFFYFSLVALFHTLWQERRRRRRKMSSRDKATNQLEEFKKAHGVRTFIIFKFLRVGLNLVLLQ